MYGTTGMPDLIPPAGSLRPRSVVSYNTGHGDGSNGAEPPRRTQRAPKLGQIGRSKRVIIDDEDLDDIMNNNRGFPISVSPVA
ncbi:hypothetical protein P4O66_008594 [Electrophorus voltai]|uniref:Uncharacterized protein n=2 Tax=Electrophorus TaxID=8004 RepID=A0AAD9DVQ8_9TELE|nr:hypothetical protein P4O66_008594 [Electrophorus voltai]